MPSKKVPVEVKTKAPEKVVFAPEPLTTARPWYSVRPVFIVALIVTFAAYVALRIWN